MTIIIQIIRTFAKVKNTEMLLWFTAIKYVNAANSRYSQPLGEK